MESPPLQPSSGRSQDIKTCGDMLISFVYL